MKKLSIVLMAIVAVCFCATHVMARGDYSSTKEKRMNKHYNVQFGDKMRIENTFGKVHVNTWDKNEVTVDIVITTKANSDSKAASMMDKIDIHERTENHTISYRTEVGSMHNNNGDIEIDYTINMPRKNPLEVLNKFGDVYLDDFDAELQMEVSYGGLRTEKLIGPNVRIKVSFGSANIAQIEKGRINISYSKLTIGRAGEIDVVNKFGSSDINTVKRLSVDQQYGDLDIENVDEINGSVQFANMRIEKLGKLGNVSLKYSGKSSIGVGKDAEQVIVNGSFSTVQIKLDKDASLSADVSTSFGKLRSGPYELYSSSKDDDDHNSRRYTGKIGGGKGSLRVTASYGDVILSRL